MLEKISQILLVQPRAWKLSYAVLISFFLFRFAVSCVYYGLTLNAASLGGDPFSNLLIASSFEVVANFLTISQVNYVGKAPTATGSQILAGAFCIAMPFAYAGKIYI